MTLREAEELFWFHAKRVGLPDDYKFGWKPRRVKFNQSGTHYGGTIRMIKLQPTFVEINSIEIVEQTIIHELAHALVPPRSGHNDIWKRKAIELGHSGKRCYGKEVNNNRKK